VKFPISLPFRRAARPTFPTAADFGYVELRGGGSRVVVIPSLGGKISEMELAGRQWLWTSDVLPYAAPTPGASYIETADTGGYDECFPTVGACRIPGWVKAFGGIELPDHGELWSQSPTLEIETTKQGQCAVTSWQGARLPYRLTRIARVAPDGDVVLDYHLANDAEDRFPFIWSSQPLFPMTPDTEVHLPEGAEMRVYGSHRISLGDHQSKHRWPFVRAAGKVMDFLKPFEVAKQYACKLFLDVPEGRGRAILRQDGVELEVDFDASSVGQFGLWLNKQGWTPFKKEAPYLNLAFEPCIGAPDTLSDALGDWKRAQWLEPGEVRSWSLTWRGRRTDAKPATS
jgi:galactose mutarotase-like enzyme